MACDLRRFMNLPIEQEFKMALVQYFQDPKNGEACEVLSQASDEEIVRNVQNMKQSIQQKQQGAGGPPSPAGPPNPALPQVAPQGPGPSARPPSQQAGVGPGDIANTPMPMQVAANAQAPRGYMRGGVASLHRGRRY